MDMIAMLALGTIVDENWVTNNIPHMEKSNVLGMDGVEPMELIDNKE